MRRRDGKPLTSEGVLSWCRRSVQQDRGEMVYNNTDGLPDMANAEGKLGLLIVGTEEVVAAYLIEASAVIRANAWLIASLDSDEDWLLTPEAQAMMEVLKIGPQGRGDYPHRGPRSARIKMRKKGRPR
jgi:hypothetical protein